jgi:hypothetical protein
MPLGIIEVRRDGDDNMVDFLVQILLGSLPYFDEDH